tara:strand:- start:584 stop:970 length:387 start_codon:yes stop_codon:yes gene_type:complete
MNKNKVLNIINKVYPLISKDYSCNAKIELHYNIYERLSGEKGMCGTACAQAEYDWSENKIYLYTSRLFNEEDIIRSLIHECVHSNQNKEIFNAYYLCGKTYSNHPYEIEARNAEKNWKKYKLNTISIG